MTDLGGQVDRVLEDDLARLIEAVVRHTAVLARARRVSPTDLRAVGLIGRADGMRPGELARALELSSSGTSAVISRLTTAGLLDRDSGPVNHRDVRVWIPSGGVDELGLAPGRQIAGACELAGLNASERELVATFVVRLVELIERDTDAIRTTIPRDRDRLPSPPRWA